MPSCFVPGCKSSTRRNIFKASFFTPPKDEELLGLWTDAISREDRVLSRTDKVCSLHFHSSDIVHEFRHNINGEEVIIERRQPHLQPTAIPSIFPDMTLRGSSTGVLKRKRRKVPAPDPQETKVETSVENNGSSGGYENDGSSERYENNNKVPRFDFAVLLEIVSDAVLPPLWRHFVNSSKDAIFFCKEADFDGNSTGVRFDREIMVQRTLEPSVFAHGRRIPLPVQKIENFYCLMCVIESADKITLCCGIKCADSQVSYSKECTVISEEQTCSSCEQESKTLQNESKQIQNKCSKESLKQRPKRKRI